MISAKEAKQQSVKIRETKAEAARKQRREEQEKLRREAQRLLPTYLKRAKQAIQNAYRKGYEVAQIEVPYDDLGTQLASLLGEELRKYGYTTSLFRKRNTDWHDESYLNITWHGSRV